MRKTIVALAIFTAMLAPLSQAGAQPAQPPSTVVLVGNEDLQGYSNLTFELTPTGQAVMTDAQGRTSGTWQAVGNQLRLQFFGGTVVYQGTRQGNAIVGRATNGQVTWNWSVQPQQAPNAPVAMPNPGAQMPNNQPQALGQPNQAQAQIAELMRERDYLRNSVADCESKLAYWQSYSSSNPENTTARVAVASYQRDLATYRARLAEAEARLAALGQR